MSKNERPPLRMIVQPMRLVPADAYSEEMLDRIPVGTGVECRLTSERTSKKRRRYWAILERVIQTCPVRWKRVDEASDALKHALGVVYQISTVSGAIIRYPLSLSALGDDEFEDYYRGAMALLHKITGVDPETLKKEAADVGGDEPDDTSAQEPVEEQPPVEQAPQPGESPTTLIDAASGIAKMLALATDPAIPDPADRIDELRLAATNWTKALPSHAGLWRTCLNTAAQVARGQLEKNAASRYLNSLPETG